MILIIQGAPATGKSTLATQLSTELQLPHISRDNITEWIMNSASEDERGYLKFIAHTGYDLAFDMAGEMSKGRGSFIVEGCFNPEFAGSRMIKTLVPGNHEIVELFLRARNEVLIDRYKRRATSVNRHAAHGDDESKIARFIEHLKEIEYKPMGIGMSLIEIDTGDNPEATLEIALRELRQYPWHSTS